MAIGDDFFKRLTFQEGFGGALDPFGLFGGGEQPIPPQFQLPEFAQGLQPEILDLIRGQSGQTLQQPDEFGIASNALQGLLQQQPDQFQLPIQEIQDALSAQQDIQMQQFLDTIRPIAARQGQLDSSAFQNQVGGFLQNQQAQSLGSRADLLTQQALQNLQTQRALPGFQAGVAGQLAGLGGQRAGIDQFNLQLPFNTSIPALQNVFSQGLSQGDREFQSALLPFQQQQNQFDQEQAQRQQLLQGLGSLGTSALTGGFSALGGGFGPDVSFLQGAGLGLGGTQPISPSLQGLLNQNIAGQGTGNFQFIPRQQQLKPLNFN